MKKDVIKDMEMAVQNSEYLDEVKKKQFKRIIYLIKTFENPYPRDIFSWENTEPVKLNRGRFQEFIFTVVESTRNRIIKRLEEEYEETNDN